MIKENRKRYITQKEKEDANLLADLIAGRLLPKFDSRISRIETAGALGERVSFVKELLEKDLERLCMLSRSAFRVFVFIFRNGPSHLYDIQKDSGMKERTIYDATKQLEKADIVDKDDEDRYFIKAKGFAILT